jgi:soluble lytic murein transglycosylase-like protein
VIIELGVFAAGYFLLNGSKSEASPVATSNKKSIPTYDSLFKKEAAKWGFDWKILKAISMQESSLGRNSRVARGLAVPTDIAGSTSTDGKSWGLMQLRVSTARDFDPSATEVKLNNAEYSVKIAAQYIAWTYTQFRDQPYLEFIVKSYNQGVTGTKNEIAGLRKGAANEYWALVKANYELIKGET